MKRSNTLYALLTGGSNLICSSNHTTPPYGHLTVVIDGISYQVIHETANMEYYLSIGMITDFFKEGIQSLVRFSSSHIHKIGFICFNNILPFSRSYELFSQLPNPQMNFSVYLFTESLITIQFAKQTNKDAPNFALGHFNVRSFIQQLRIMMDSLREYRIHVLWKMFVHALHRNGYFDIFDYNDFQSIVLVGFLRLFTFVNSPHVLRNLFCLFVQRLLSNNCWFMIFGDKYRPIRGRPSRALIELFWNGRCPPIVNFVGLDCVGVITNRLECALVSLSTTNVCILGSINDDDSRGQQPSCFSKILLDLFPCDDCDDFDDGDSCLLRRQPTGLDTKCIKPTFSKFGKGHLVVFKLGNYMKMFIVYGDGTFKNFSPYLFILMNMWSVDDSLSQLTNQFEEFPCIHKGWLINALLECEFEQIFDETITATMEQIKAFLLNSSFGVVLQLLMMNFEGFEEQLRRRYHHQDSPDETFETHIASIQENRFLMDFRCVFEFILNKLGGSEHLEPEIKRILQFLDQLVKFLTRSS